MIGIVMLAAAVAATCPTRSGRAGLHAVTLYDGPVADNAMLAPDTTRRKKGVTVQTWQVGGVYRAGRTLNIRCDYGAHAARMLMVAQPVRICRLTWRGNVRAFGCD